MSDPIDRLLDAVEAGKSIIKNRDILHFTYIPKTIQYRKTEQEQITQSLSPILKQSTPPNLLVYGEPGTGKTLVIKTILGKIQTRVEKSNFPIFNNRFTRFCCIKHFINWVRHTQTPSFPICFILLIF